MRKSNLNKLMDTFKNNNKIESIDYEVDLEKLKNNILSTCERNLIPRNLFEKYIEEFIKDNTSYTKENNHRILKISLKNL